MDLSLYCGFEFVVLCHRHHATELCMLYKVNSNSNNCLFIEHPPASTRVRHARAAAAGHPLEIVVSRCRTSKFPRRFLLTKVRMWNELPNTVFNTGHWMGLGAVNHLLLD